MEAFDTVVVWVVDELPSQLYRGKILIYETFVHLIQGAYL